MRENVPENSRPATGYPLPPQIFNEGQYRGVRKQFQSCLLKYIASNELTPFSSPSQPRDSHFCTQSSALCSHLKQLHSILLSGNKNQTNKTCKCVRTNTGFLFSLIPVRPWPECWLSSGLSCFFPDSWGVDSPLEVPLQWDSLFYEQSYSLLSLSFQIYYF